MITLPWAPTLPIRTSRLLLRAHEHGDLDDILEYHSDPEVVRYLPWPVRDHALAAEALVPRLRQGRVDVEGEWLVLAIQLVDGPVIGEVVLKCASVEKGEAELGYALHRAHHGLGIASEAASAMIRLAIEQFGVSRLTAELNAGNAASVRLLERLGFSQVRSYEATFKGEPTSALEYELRVQ